MKNILTVCTCIVLVCFFQCQPLVAQQEKNDYPWQVGVGIGYTNYYGDVSNYRINTMSDIGKIYHFADFNHYYVPSPSFSLLLQKKINPTVGIMFQLNSVSFSMSDRYRNKNGSLDESALNFSRSLNFKTDVQDAGFALTFSAANGHTLKENSFFYPSFYLGAGIALFNVYGDLYDANGNAYNYHLPGNINDGRFETNLRDIKTETQNRYSNITPYLDLGLSLNFRLSNLLTLSLQSDIKYAGTDYMDDLSGKYKTVYPSPSAAYAAHPGYNTIDPVTLKRGDLNNVNDIYINNRLVLHFALSHKKKYIAFKAPAVYSLTYATPAYATAYKNSADTIRHSTTADTVIIHKDSALIIQDTLPRYQKDTVFQQRVDRKLDSIQLQLIGIKTVVRNNAFEAKYQYLRSRQDSLKQLKRMIQLQKTISREDNLRMRIYDLQTDSLRNEMQLLQRRAEAGFDDSDSSWMHSSAYQYNFTQPAMVVALKPATDSLLQRPDSLPMHTDTLTDQQILGLATSLQQTKNDKRYAKDSAYRITIDSLNKKLNSYAAAKNREAGQLKMSDSLHYQQQLMQKDSTYAIDSREKDTVLNNSLLALQSSLQKNNDSLAVLRYTLSKNTDSAAYYKQLAFAAIASSDSLAKRSRKWYQRIIPGKSKKEERLREDESQKINDREEYYDAQINRLNDQVNSLQQRNHSLNNDFETTRRRREERIAVYTPPYTSSIQNTGRQNDDLHDLRNEITALRNQLILQQAIETGINSRNTTVKNRATDTIYVQAPVNTVPASAPAVNPQMLAMQEEIARLKAELEGMKAGSTKAAAAPVISKDTVQDITVYFGIGASTLTGPQLAKLSAFGKKAAAGTQSGFVLTGYTDASGNAAKNIALAKKRMLYVQHILVTQYDIPVERIQLDEPVPDKAGKGKSNALDRKVTIKMQ